MVSLRNISFYGKLSIWLCIGSFLIFNSCVSTPHEKLITLEVPTSGINNSEPYLHHSETGDLYLSWVENDETNKSALRFSKITNNGWSVPNLIAILLLSPVIFRLSKEYYSSSKINPT